MWNTGAVSTWRRAIPQILGSFPIKATDFGLVYSQQTFLRMNMSRATSHRIDLPQCFTALLKAVTFFLRASPHVARHSTHVPRHLYALQFHLCDTVSAKKRSCVNMHCKHVCIATLRCLPRGQYTAAVISSIPSLETSADLRLSCNFSSQMFRTSRMH